MEGVINSGKRKLIRSIEGLDAILTNAADGILIADTQDKTFVYCNPMICKMLGRTAEEILTMNVAEIHPDRELAFVLSEFEQQVKSEITLAEDIPVMRKDGSVFFADVNSFLINIKGRKCLVGFFRDITERKKQQELHFELDRKLRAITSCNQILLRAKDEQSLLNEVCRIICEEAGYRLCWVGYAEHDKNKTINPVAWAGFESGYIAEAKLTWSENSNRGKGPAGLCIRNNKVIIIKDFETEPRMRLWRENALRRGYHSGIALPLKDDNSGLLGALLIYASDPDAVSADEARMLEQLAADLVFGIVTLRNRKAQILTTESLKKTTERLVEAQHIAQIGSWELDITTNFLTWSEEVYRIFEIDPAEFNATYDTFLDAVHPDDREMVNKAYINSLFAKKAYSIDHRILLPDGRIKYIHEECENFYDHDKPIRSIGTVQNITQSKLAEEAVQMLNQELEKRVEERTEELLNVNKELEAFAYSISHDLRAPLRAVSGFASILLKDYRDLMDENGKRRMNIVISEAKRMDELLNGLLKLSRVGRDEIKFGEVDLVSLAQTVFDELLINENKARVKCIIEHLPPVYGDLTLLHQVFFNLISNALKFSSRKEQSVITVGYYVDPKSLPVYFIRDNGAGFDMKDVDKLFNVFNRLHADEEYEGSGIGLSIVQRIIHRHKGKIWATAEVGAGATFFFTIRTKLNQNRN